MAPDDQTAPAEGEPGDPTGPSVNRLHKDTWGSGGDDRLAMIHGFTQNAHCWAQFAARLATGDREIIAVDLPGHGGSSGARTDLWETADLVADACGPAVYVGYSLGGRVLLHVALAHPESTRAMILIGATAGIEEPAARADRRHSDEVLAKRLDACDGDPDAFATFIHDWLEGPLFAHLAEDEAQIPQRLENDPVALASSLRLCGTGAQDPLWDRLAGISVPVLVLAGEYDERFTAIGTRISSSIGGNARFEIVKGSGHSCHLEQPHKTLEIVEEFLKEVSR
ncbi:MAG: alpha/beta fold hydrolase [Acidimicrobiales bacterium]